MRVSVFFVLSFFLIFLFACQNQEDFNKFLLNQKLSDTTSYRLHFTDVDDFKKYLSENEKSDNAINVPTKSSSDSESILDLYFKLTPMRKVFNQNYEFQIGDTILKLGKSGYTVYRIDSDKYNDVVELVSEDSRVIENINSYKKIDENTYEITKGLLIDYSGEPIIEIYPIKTKTFRASTAWNIDVNFWRSSSFFYVACGIEMRYKELISGKLKEKSTDLQMQWTNTIIQLVEKNNAAGPILNLSGTKNDTGSYDKKTFDDYKGVNLGKFKYQIRGGSLIGRAKYQEQWVEVRHNGVIEL
jgi:hypothetical protein